MGTVAPVEGFNAALKDNAHADGALLILDEVMTGFRTSQLTKTGESFAHLVHHREQVSWRGTSVGSLDVELGRIERRILRRGRSSAAG